MSVDLVALFDALEDSMPAGRLRALASVAAEIIYNHTAAATSDDLLAAFIVAVQRDVQGFRDGTTERPSEVAAGLRAARVRENPDNDTDSDARNRPAGLTRAQLTAIEAAIPSDAPADIDDIQAAVQAAMLSHRQGC